MLSPSAFDVIRYKIKLSINLQKSQYLQVDLVFVGSAKKSSWPIDFQLLIPRQCIDYEFKITVGSDQKIKNKTIQNRCLSIMKIQRNLLIADANAS